MGTVAMGIWQFASGPIVDIALLALAGGAVPGDLATHVSGGAWPPTREAAMTGVSPEARPMVVDFTLSPVTPGSTGQPAKAIRRARDGLFYVDAWVNGVPVRFLVDTGATTVVLTPGDAARAGVLPEAAAFRHFARTAGGPTAMARIRLARLTAGVTERRDVDAAIAGGGLTVSLLGQSYLSQLNSVRISGNLMTLE